MAFIDTTLPEATNVLQEGTFLDDFASLLTTNGWTEELTFKKASYDGMLSNSTMDGTPSYEFFVATHKIFSNADGKFLGVAVGSSWDGENDIDDVVTIPQLSAESGLGDTTEFETYLEDKSTDNKVTTSIYFYMVENLPDFTADSMTIAPSEGTEKFALDVEVKQYAGGKSDEVGDYPIVISDANPKVMQSPITKSTLRPEFIEDVDYPEMMTNWWSDSEVALRGVIDDTNIFVVLQADNVPAWENNVIPSVPLYFGKLTTVSDSDNAVAMFAGTVASGTSESDVAEFDFDDPTVRVGEKIMPVLKNYPSHPSNGIDTVMVSRSRFGSRYQEYFLSWNTSPNTMPPDRQGADGKEYPRSWNHIHEDEYKFQFNPSRYSNKVHTSRIYVVHPEEGVRGHLSQAVGLNAINFSAGKLRIRKQNCPTKEYEVYRYFSIGGVSPLTKRPGTAYRPMGIGIYEEDYIPST